MRLTKDLSATESRIRSGWPVSPSHPVPQSLQTRLKHKSNIHIWATPSEMQTFYSFAQNAQPAILETIHAHFARGRGNSELAAQVRELKGVVEVLSQRVTAMESAVLTQLAAIEHASTPQLHKTIDAAINPYQQWISDNASRLMADFPNSFVGIDIRRGVVVSAPDQDAFVRQLLELSADERAQLYQFNTALLA